MAFKDAQNFKSDTLAVTMAAGATSATLTSGNFAAFTDGYLVVDYDNPSKREIIRCTVSGTSVSSVTRAQSGTSDVEHAPGAKVIWSFNNAHLQQLSDGWLLTNEAWAYASASTITVPSGAASRYSVGDLLKLTQTTVKYFVVTAVADTVLTVRGWTTETVADAAISENYYHKMSAVGVTQGTWIEVLGGVGFANSWVNFDSSHDTAGYMMDALGWVCIKGTIKSGTVGAAAFTLPSGYRPSAIKDFVSYSDDGASNSGSQRVVINTDGTVVPTGGWNAIRTLEGIRFRP